MLYLPPDAMFKDCSIFQEPVWQVMCSITGGRSSSLQAYALTGQLVLPYQ
jgi:hypothetical protein